MESDSLQYVRSTSFTHNSTLRDASFSSYLKPTQPSPICHSELSIFDAQKYFNETITPTTNLDPKKEIRTSVSSTTIEERARLSSVSSVTDGYSRNYRIRSFHATPTASSEASWNSQTGLLSKPPGSITISLKNPIPTDNRNSDDQRERKERSSGRKWFFRPRCPCSGQKSVQVREKKLTEPNPYNNNHRNAELVASSRRNSATILQERTEKVLPKSHLPSVSSYVPSNTAQKSSNQQGILLETVYSTARPGVLSHGNTTAGGGGEGFSFPILKKMGLPQIPTHEDPPRDSLEVFQPSSSDEPISNKSTIVRDGRATGYNFSFVGSPISRVIGKDDDVASDASSDLFEIESFSTQTTNTSCYPMYLRRESLDEASTFSNIRRLALVTGNGGSGCTVDEPTTPSVAPTECYEPSEASIDWSVTTAEGFDRASMTNYSSVSAWEWDNGGGGSGNRQQGGGGWGIMEGGKMNRKGNFGLLSCRHEKAVSVGPNPVKCVLEEQPYGSFPLISSTTRHVSGRVTNPKMPSLVATTSRSTRLSPPFAAPPVYT